MKVRLSDTPAERVDADLVVLVVASDKLARLRALKIAGSGLGPFSAGTLVLTLAFGAGLILSGLQGNYAGS